MSSAFHFCHPISVRRSEVGARNVVFHSRYLEYCVVAVTEYFRAAGAPLGEMAQAHGCHLVVARAEFDLASLAGPDDRLDVYVRIAGIGRTSLTASVEIRRRADAALVLRGQSRHVAIGAATGAAMPIPASVRRVVAVVEGAAIAQ